MRKNVFGRQFKRDANERKALFKNLLTSLVIHERIRTTEEKAKAIKADADKLITKAKKGGDAAYRNLSPQVNHDAVVKLINEIAPRFSDRKGGYTRVFKTGRRINDNAAMAIIEWTELPALKVKAETKTQNKETKKKDTKEARVSILGKKKKETKKEDKKENKKQKEEKKKK